MVTQADCSSNQPVRKFLRNHLNYFRAKKKSTSAAFEDVSKACLLNAINMQETFNFHDEIQFM